MLSFCDPGDLNTALGKANLMQLRIVGSLREEVSIEEFLRLDWLWVCLWGIGLIVN